MTISPLPLLDVSDVGSAWPDDVVDLTDRRRLLVLAVLGVDVSRRTVDALFCAADHPSSTSTSSSSTTMRSGGRVPRTDAT